MNEYERQWSDWWEHLPAGERSKIEEAEARIGTRLTWNNRYLLVTGGN